ncbi:MAG: sulfatase [Gemmatimonadota bacterium]
METSRRDLLLLGLWAGAVTGLGESLLLLFKRFVRHRFIAVGTDTFWMVPLTECLIFLLITLVLLAATSRTSIDRQARVLTSAVIGLSSGCILLLWGRFHWIAIVLLSVGLGMRLGQWLIPRSSTLHTVVRRTLPAAIVTILFIMVGVAGSRWRGDRANAAASGTGKPNILLIILDTVRSYNLGLYGYSKNTTPGLSRWANRGTVFERAIAPSSWTLPSHATMFTGHWPTELSVSYQSPLDDTYPTLAEVLGEQGYATGGFVANLLYTTRESGLSRGFRHYEDYGLTWGEFLRSAILVRRLVDHPRWKWMTRRWRPLSWRSADDVSDEALTWIERRKGKPWFAFLNYIEAHDPWFVPPPFDTLFGEGAHRISWKDITRYPLPPPADLRSFEEAYNGALAYLDSRVTGLLDSLQQGGQLANTIVVITADHGEEIGEHGVLGHGRSLYRPVVQVPLLVLLPWCGLEGRRIARPVSLRDLPATIADLATIQRSPFPGSSMGQLFCQPSKADPADQVFSVLKVQTGPGQGNLVSVVLDTLRYISTRDGTGELYDFEHDPWEKHNLIATPAGAAALSRYRGLTDSLLLESSAGHRVAAHPPERPAASP